MRAIPEERSVTLTDKEMELHHLLKHEWCVYLSPFSISTKSETVDLFSAFRQTAAACWIVLTIC
jgi:hypothetical protein